MGPKTIEPIRIPNGEIEKSIPAEASLNFNFEIRSGATEPSVINAIPNNNMPMHAAAKTIFLLYMIQFIKRQFAAIPNNPLHAEQNLLLLRMVQFGLFAH